jgi:hypothetical protein
VTGLNGITTPLPVAAGAASGVDSTIHPGLVSFAAGANPVVNSAFAGTASGYDMVHGTYLLGTVTFSTTATTGTGTLLQVKDSTVNLATLGIGSAMGRSNPNGSASPWTAAYTDLGPQFNKPSAGVFASATINVTASVARPGDISSNGINSTPDGNVNANDIDKMANDIRAAGGSLAVGVGDPRDLRGATVGSPPDGLVDQHDFDREVGSLIDINAVPTSVGTHYGDANLSGKVDFADFLILQNHFGLSAQGWANGNFNGNIDDKVNFADFLILQNNFGLSGGTGQLTAVPEPSTLVLSGLAIIGMFAIRRRVAAK